jgi:site-specific DNA recombinase
VSVAVGYVRVSSTEQAREGYSLAAQERAIRAYCEAHGWQVLAVYVDAGRSGKSVAGRPQLQELLAGAARREFQHVVIWKLDRLARNLRDLLAIGDRLEANGIGLASLSESFDSGTAVGRMLRNVLGSFAQFEREVIAERIRDGIAEKALQGELVGPLPLGYVRDQSGAVVTDPVVAPLVRELFLRYATGRHSLRDLTAWARSTGLRSREGNPLDRLSIRKVLTNVSYTGQVARSARKGGGIVANGRHPAIVDAALYAQVQDQLVRRRRAQDVSTHRPFGRTPYPLSGLTICGYDGAGILGNGTKHGRYRYLRCSTAQRQGREACLQPMVRSDVIEAQLVEYLRDMRFPPDYLGEVVAWLRQHVAAPQDAEAAHRIQRELERWKRLYVTGEIDEPEYRRETAPLRRQLASVQRPVEVLDVEEAVLLLRRLGELWPYWRQDQQREFVHRVFERLVIRDDRLVVIQPRLAFAPLFLVDRRERFGGEFVFWLPEQVRWHQDYELPPPGAGPGLALAAARL